MFSELMDSFTDKDKKGHTRLTFGEQFFFWIHLQNKVPKKVLNSLENQVKGVG
jgi:hypothetical protein